MKLITEEIRRQLIRNGEHSAQARDLGDPEPDFEPVVKLFTPDAQCTWLLTELDPGDHDIAFGLCDLGMGFPELGSVRLSELDSVRGPLGLAIERDRHFRADRTLSAYVEQARSSQHITA